ncbi:hypothetical protein ANCCEY_14242 [Ancylostoma ceylanicum]|uniref:Uncharacterized protein n=1 Tax=Ancylostoma ceylanicum TaxID=53326 RepID=A0A0D6L5V5_9BILA|nr:hypothetical protein ANCCEY_14242 [Ancylostoma ceylanicum]
MAAQCFLLVVLLVIQRSHASFPHEGIEGDFCFIRIKNYERSSKIPTRKGNSFSEVAPIAVAPIPEVEAAPIHAVPAVAKAEYAVPAPVVAPAPAVAPAPVIAHAAPQPIVVQAQPVVQPAPVPVPYPVHVHHHNPRTEVHNVVSNYHKESGHTSATAMVSGDHHAFHDMDLHPAGHFLEDDHHAEPWKARKHHQKLALKKAARKHKVARKHKAARKQKTFEKKN